MAVSLLAALLGFRDRISDATRNMSLDELKRAPRVRSVVAESEEDVEVVRDILWSDPWDQSDVVDNFKRNAGCLIPDTALGEWLQREKFVQVLMVPPFVRFVQLGLSCQRTKHLHSDSAAPPVQK